MNYTQELLDSLFWILKAIGITAVLFSLTLYVLTRTTRWGRQFWLLARGYFSLKRSVKPMLYFTVIVFFNLLAVRLDILFSEWYKAMYNALQEMNESVFWIQMVVFSVLASVHIGNLLLTYYLTQRFIIRWRTWLNEQMVSKWTENQAYYKTQFIYHHYLDNPDQRIQQDVLSYVSDSIDFATGVISSVVSIVAFTIILWDLSGPMNIAGVSVPHAMVFLVFIYVLVSSVFAFKIGRPLIRLNFANERLNANYRYSLIRLKEYAESIAFFRGERMEKNVLFKQFDSVIQNLWQIVYRTLKLSGFNLAISQISVIFPFIIQAARYFGKQIQLGELIQTANAFGKVQTALSFFRNSYKGFTGYRAVLDRLTGFYSAIDQANRISGTEIQDSDATVAFENLTVNRPNGDPLIKNLTLDLPPGSSLLIRGVSGAGKTTLLRTIAGLWSYSEGGVRCPQHDTLFLSQKPYLPQGRLIDALYYPEVAPTDADPNQAVEIIRKVQLGHLADKLEREDDWSRVLSLGEQQRLSFARVLLHKPLVVFLDEATASMDEELEEAMYRLLKTELPHTTIISVGHRSTLMPHHRQHLMINANDQSWQLI